MLVYAVLAEALRRPKLKSSPGLYFAGTSWILCLAKEDLEGKLKPFRKMELVPGKKAQQALQKREGWFFLGSRTEAAVDRESLYPGWASQSKGLDSGDS